MEATIESGRTTAGPATILLRVGIICLTLATAWIHYTLGSPLFLANAAGYVVLAVALILPGPLGRIRWLVRLALLGFTITTIAAWVAFGARFELAYIDKAIEVALVALLGLDILHSDGGPLALARRGRRLVTQLLGA